MPAELLRYFVVKNRPSRTLVFDSGMGLVQLMDEYVRERESAAAGVAYARAAKADETIAGIPFGHLIQSYQAARRDPERTLELLARSGYEDVVSRDREVVLRELRFVANWLDQYAPASVKFELRETMPKAELSAEQKAFLGKLLESVKGEELNAQGMHDAVYAAAQEAGLKPGQAFVAIYRAFLGQDSGPKAGWFLTELDRDFLINRLREASS
jgi:lysyl-tRNA synthetase class 1